MTVEGLLKHITATGNTLIHIYQGPRIGQYSKAAFCTDDYAEDITQLTPEQAANLVEEFMEDMPPGKYVARLKKGPKSGPAEREIQFDKSGMVAGGKISGYDDIGRLEQQFEERFKNWQETFEAKQEKKTLETRVKELEAEVKELNDQPKINFFIEKLFDHAVEKGWIVPSPVAAVSGQPSVPPVYETPSEAEAGNDRVNDAMNTIATKIGMNTIPLVEKLAKIDPTKLEKLANMPEEQLRGLLNYL
ncbi:MAG: hypothetical protein SF052_15700 [Bacteroidia bacterium]|nr:hypothetical protein [Bacteroidia bacterium]